MCPKTFQNLDEAIHHLNLDHVGMSEEHLSMGTTAHLTKKQLGDYVKIDGVGACYECPDCFEIFSDPDKLDKHRKKNHHLQLTDDAKQKLKELTELSQNECPICEICKNKFLGLILCKINGKPTGACMNCYENHYGVNALTRLTIGTPDAMIKKMKTPLL